MKQVNFSHPGGFPLEQETLDRLQTAYRHELFEALKSHLGINPDNDYIIAPPKNGKEGWAIIHPKNEQGVRAKEGILYPIQTEAQTNFLKTIRTGTNLTYGTGVIQTAYFDYEAKYISDTDYANRPVSPPITDALTVHYYNLNDPAFIVIKDIQTIEGIINSIKTKIDLVEADIKNYLPLNGSKAMKGDLDLGIYKLSKLDIKESATANVRVTDFRLGSNLGRAIVNDSTNLSLNYGSDWENTNIGGKVYLNNISSSNSIGSLLVVDSSNQVTKSNILIESLIKRITDLEEKPATAVPKGMIAIWGKPAPFPEGWEEYVPLRGRVPVGLDIAQTEFNTIGNTGGSKNKQLTIDEMPSHGHDWLYSYEGDDDNTGRSYDEFTFKPGKIAITDAKNPIGKTGGNQTFSILNPYKIVHFIEYTGRPSDTIKPISPTNLEVSNITNSSLTLSWTAATDNVAVTNYLVSINNGLPFLVGNVPSYTVVGLSPNTLYNFYVIAQDAAGNVSDKSNVANATTMPIEVNKPLTPTNIGAILENFKDITIFWGTTENNAKFELWRRPSYQESYNLITSEAIVENFFYDLDTSYNTSYYYKVRAMNTAGVFSDFSTDTSITTNEKNACFDVESLVTMASGQSEKLKNILVGDKLQGLTFPNEIDESEGDYMLWNGKLNEGTKAEVTVVDKRTSIQPNYYEIQTEDTTIKVTGEHPLLITEDGENVKYVYTKNVVKTMSLVDKTGRTKTIESIVFKEEPLEVALLDVENVDNYVISGIVVHNSKPADPK